MGVSNARKLLLTPDVFQREANVYLRHSALTVSFPSAELYLGEGLEGGHKQLREFFEPSSDQKQGQCREVPQQWREPSRPLRAV